MIIKVVACILHRRNKVLISSRPPQKELAGFYEFPGGKVKENELAVDNKITVIPIIKYLFRVILNAI